MQFIDVWACFCNNFDVIYYFDNIEEALGIYETLNSPKKIVKFKTFKFREELFDYYNILDRDYFDFIINILGLSGDELLFELKDFCKVNENTLDFMFDYFYEPSAEKTIKRFSFDYEILKGEVNYE